MVNPFMAQDFEFLKKSEQEFEEYYLKVFEEFRSFRENNLGEDKKFTIDEWKCFARFSMDFHSFSDNYTAQINQPPQPTIQLEKRKRRQLDFNDLESEIIHKNQPSSNPPSMEEQKFDKEDSSWFTDSSKPPKNALEELSIQMNVEHEDNF